MMHATMAIVRAFMGRLPRVAAAVASTLLGVASRFATAS
jgi:hypothetical protein